MEGMMAPDELTWLVVVGGIAMAYMAWGIGANDVANAFGPAFGAKCLTVRQACVVAGVCEAAGAILMGGHVSDTIRKGMMSVKLYQGDDGRVLVMVGMTSVLIAAATWLLAASKLGLPVSTTHSAVGGVIAFAVTSKGYGSVNWEKVGMIVASWFISPVAAGIVGFLMYRTLSHFVLQHTDSVRRAKMAAPGFVFLVSFVVALFTVYKGGKGLGLHNTSVELAVGSSVGIATLLAIASYPFVSWWAAKIKASAVAEAVNGGSKGEAQAADPEFPQELEKGSDTKQQRIAAPAEQAAFAQQDEVKIAVKGEPPAAAPEEAGNQVHLKVGGVNAETEQLFTGFVVIIAGFFSLAHGANDVANSIGPFGAVLAAFEGPLQKKSEIPMWVFFLAGLMIVVGLATYGIHVMRTIGNNITPMTPSKAFCVNFSSTIAVLFATRLGIPISTTHASVGAVVGVGLAEGVRKVEWNVMVKVFLSWILTLPVVGITAAGIFALLLPTVIQVPFAAAS